MERRLSPRVEIKMPVEVKAVDGQVFTLQSLDLSYMGISFNCDHWTSRQLFHEGSWSGPKDKITLGVSFELNDGLLIDTDALVTRFLRLSENEYHLGVQFLNLDDETQRALVHFINEKRGTA